MYSKKMGFLLKKNSKNLNIFMVFLHKFSGFFKQGYY